MHISSRSERYDGPCQVNEALSFLKCHVKAAPAHQTLAAYTTRVRPELEYVSASWDAHRSELIATLEGLQNSAIPLIYSVYSSATIVTLVKVLSTRRRLPRLFSRLSH